MKKYLAIVLCLITVFALFTGCSTTGKEKIVVSEVTHSLFYAPQYAAIELGYFEEEGLELELVNGQGADKVMTAVISGQVDIGLAGPESCVYIYNEGKEDFAQVFAQLTKRDGSFLFSKVPIENFDYSMLAGKHVIGGRPGGMPLMTFEYVLKEKGLKPYDDLYLDTSVHFAIMAGAFTSGDADFVTLFEPTASELQKAGKGYIVASIGQDSGEIPYTAYFATKSYIAEHPDVIQKFTNAVYRGQQWVQQATAKEIAALIAPHFPDADMELLEAAVQSYKDSDAWNDVPFMKEEAFNRMQDVIEKAGELDARAPYDQVVNNTFANNAMK